MPSQYCDFISYLNVQSNMDMPPVHNGDPLHDKCADAVYRATQEMVFYVDGYDAYDHNQDCYTAKFSADSPEEFLAGLRLRSALSAAGSSPFITNGIDRFVDQGSRVNTKSTDAFAGFHCYAFDALTAYLNLDDVRDAIHVPSALKDTKWAANKNLLETANYTIQHFDMTPFFDWVRDRGYPLNVLVYNGDSDAVCNFLGAVWFVETLGFDVVEEHGGWYYQQRQRHLPTVAGFAKKFRSGQLNVDLLTVKHLYNMGIVGLSKWAKENAADCFREKPLKAYAELKIAIGTSMCLYQFLTAVRQDGEQLQNANGEATSHLSGIFYRTIRLMENGIKPVFVFDGKPPEHKSDKLQKRDERRAKAEEQLEEAEEIGDTVAMEKLSRRTVKVSEQHVEGVRCLLKLMGVPVVEAPCEAEAQCAELVKTGKVFATATEDMDALPFGSTILLRNLFGKSQSSHTHMVEEYDLDKLLRGAEVSMAQFIDLCILLGCDYCPKIHGIGPMKAQERIREHKSIENVLKELNAKKYSPPPNWKFAEARKVFVEPDVIKGDEVQLAWTDPDEDGIVQFLCEENNFSEDRVRNALERLRKVRQRGTQNRMENFFKRDGMTTTVPSAKKRKAQESKNGTSKGGKRGGEPPTKRSK